MIISKTPLRVSLAGGGTDIPSFYKENDYGAVLNFAINKYVYVTVHRRFDNKIKVSYTNIECVNTVDELKHEIVKACLNMVGIKSGIEISSIGELPAGTGLGSSSAFTVGLLNALYSYVGINLSSNELFQKACEIELTVLNKPIGKQDQAAATYGGIHYFKFNSDDSVERQKINLDKINYDKLENNLVIFYTGMIHNADEVLENQKTNKQTNVSSLQYLRNQADTLHNILMDVGVGDYIGEMLANGWEYKKSLSNLISNPTINNYYNIGISCGASGGKLLGAGNGGCLLFYCDPAYQKLLAQKINLPRIDFRVAKYGSRIVYFE